MVLAHAHSTLHTLLWALLVADKPVSPSFCVSRAKLLILSRWPHGGPGTAVADIHGRASRCQCAVSFLVLSTRCCGCEMNTEDWCFWTERCVHLLRFDAHHPAAFRRGCAAAVSTSDAVVGGPSGGQAACECPEVRTASIPWVPRASDDRIQGWLKERELGCMEEEK